MVDRKINEPFAQTVGCTYGQFKPTKNINENAIYCPQVPQEYYNDGKSFASSWLDNTAWLFPAPDVSTPDWSKEDKSSAWLANGCPPKKRTSKAGTGHLLVKNVSPGLGMNPSTVMISGNTANHPACI